MSATPTQREHYELVGRGIGISWPDVDEDISVENLLGVDDELLIARDLNMGMKLKSEHAGAKNGGGYWGPRVEAKRKSRKVRRREDAWTNLEHAEVRRESGLD